MLVDVAANTRFDVMRARTFIDHRATILLRIVVVIAAIVYIDVIITIIQSGSWLNFN